jgi:hypothetical protein
VDWQRLLLRKRAYFGGIFGIPPSGITHRGENSMPFTRQGFREQSAEASTGAGDENHLAGIQCLSLLACCDDIVRQLIRCRKQSLDTEMNSADCLLGKMKGKRLMGYRAGALIVGVASAGHMRRRCSLVFPTGGCRPKLDFLDGLKAVPERAKLDKENLWLHKFRATFATWSLWAGVDLHTVQQWLGHSDMESTMLYLKPSRSQHVRDKVNQIFA